MQISETPSLACTLKDDPVGADAARIYVSHAATLLVSRFLICVWEKKAKSEFSANRVNEKRKK